jgi:uncharacterized protein YcbK (DUF882 family)
MSLSKHFNRKEFACRCGCGFDTVDSMTLEALESIRQHFDKPVNVTSGCRCLVHNKAVGGSERSQHTKGRAADIQVKGVEPSAVADYATSLGLSVGRYDSFTHVDSRSGLAARWGSPD